MCDDDDDNAERLENPFGDKRGEPRAEETWKMLR